MLFRRKQFICMRNKETHCLSLKLPSMTNFTPTAITDLTVPTANATVSPNGVSFTVSETGKIAMYIIYSLVFILGVLGNGTVVYVIGIKSKERTTSNALMTSLAVADLLASLIIPVVMVNDLAVGVWKLGLVMCKVLPSFNVLTLLASAWSLVIIAVDRCRVIRNPFQALTSPVRSGFLIAFVWGFAVCATFPYTYVLDVVDDICWDFWKTPVDQFIYFTVFEALVCYIPTIIMSAAYTTSVSALYQSELVHDGNAAKLKRIHQNKRVTVMFATVVIVFFLLTTPYLIHVFVLTYYAAFDSKYYKAHQSLFMALNYGLFTLSAINSAVNPFVYAKMHAGVHKFVQRNVLAIYATVCCKEKKKEFCGQKRETMRVTFRHRGSSHDNMSFTIDCDGSTMKS